MSTGGKIPVIELFGPTIQGEGIMLGITTHFLRLGGCGYRCSWCDSMHAVLPAEVERNRVLLTQEEILRRIDHLSKAPFLTLTGGDPCIQENLEELILGCQMRNMGVAVETQGQFFPGWLKAVDVITFSPKGPSSGMNTPIQEFRDNLLRLKQERARGKICVKVVVFGADDLEYALEVYAELKPSVARPLYDQFTFQVGSPLTSQIPSYANLVELYAIDHNQCAMTEEEAGAENHYHYHRYADSLRGRWKREAILHTYEWLVNTLLQHSELLDANTTITPQQHTLLWPTQDRGR